MSIDYVAVLEDLTEKRDAIEQVLGGLRRLAATTSASAEVAPPRQLMEGPKPKKPNRAAAKVQRRTAGSRTALKHGRTPVAISADVKAAVAQVGIGEAARRHGLSPKTLWGRAHREGWKVAKVRRGRPATATPSAAAPAKAKRPLGVKVPSYRCEACLMTTTRDPCAACGTKRKPER